MSEATLILPNMRGGCATAGGKVHTLFQVSSRSHRKMARPAPTSGGEPRESDNSAGDSSATRPAHQAGA